MKGQFLSACEQVITAANPLDGFAVSSQRLEKAWMGGRSLEKEIRYYAVLKGQTGVRRIENLMNKLILQTDYKLKAAKELVKYTIQPYEKRVRKNTHRADVNSEEDWRKVAAMIRSFIIN